MQTQRARWLSKLDNRFQNLSDELQLTQEQKEKLKNFVIFTAKEQFLEGNACGIKWERYNSSIIKTALK